MLTPLSGLYHPAVVWQDSYDGRGNFLGIMITHDDKRPDNVLMSAEHFEDDETYERKFSPNRPSCFVNQIFMKFVDWGPFRLEGRLTTEGILFIESQLNENPPRIFTEYINRNMGR